MGGRGELDAGRAAEAALLRAVRSGDPAAADELLAPYERPLFVLCRGILDHTEDAEDAVQEVFLRALRSLRDFHGRAALRTWLYRIAVNVCLEWKRARRPTEPWEAACSSVPDAVSPETIALNHLLVRDALRSLQPRHRAILLLKERERWSLAEIGAVMGWKQKRVERELSQARHALAAWRQQVGDEGDPA